MASSDEIKLAICRLRERPAIFDEFCRRYPDWERWTRGPYGKKRGAVETFLVEHGALDRRFMGIRSQDTWLNFPIKLPCDRQLTCAGDAFSQAMPDRLYLFRRAGRTYKTRPPILISSVDFSSGDLNYTEMRAGKDRTGPYQRNGIAYLTQGSLVLLAADESGHPLIASFANVRPDQIKTTTPILDGHLLASTQEPNNANFVVRATLVHAKDVNAGTGVFSDDVDALAEFQKQRADGWSQARWEGAFNDRFGAKDPLGWDGTFYEDFISHQRFEA